MIDIRLAIFIIATLGIALISRDSLRAPRSHGFYRFFAWEAIVGITLLNLDIWFRDPFSWHQIISWFLLVVSLFLVFQGFRLLKDVGKPDSERDESPMLGIEKTTTLVTVGAYRYIRHPLYSSLLFLAWGVFFKAPSWFAGFLALVATIFLVATARAEEAENIRFFGPPYRAYMERTKMFIPYLL